MALERIGDQEVKYHDGYFDNRKKNVWGLKFGTGIEYDNHYYLGIHYMAGFGDPWKYADVSGRNKAWTFTLGYKKKITPLPAEADLCRLTRPILRALAACIAAGISTMPHTLSWSAPCLISTMD